MGRNKKEPRKNQGNTKATPRQHQLTKKEILKILKENAEKETEEEREERELKKDMLIDLIDMYT